jgi:hypothetical protein
MNTITVDGSSYDILDTIEYVTLPDSFVRNKIGKGNGEGKLYVGNVSAALMHFFDDFSNECFFCKRDFIKYLLDAEQEYRNPEQNYLKINYYNQKFDSLSDKYDQMLTQISTEKHELLRFKTSRAMVLPPRVYITSDSIHWLFMRMIGLPNISYVSILKLNKPGTHPSTYYYFRMFVDYKYDVAKISPDELAAVKEIDENTKLTDNKRKALIESRIGQGEYRDNLLKQCPACPFTDVNDERLLTASHIKPWSKSETHEKTDPYNGFMFTPTYDRLFDRGFITFEDDKVLLVSPWISPMNQNRLRIYTGKRISALPIDDERKVYLKYHRENIFKR